MNEVELYVGVDVGSTTVKAVAVDAHTDEILWKDYRRHETRQPEKVLEFLKTIASVFPGVPENQIRVFMTGCGGQNIGRHIGARFVQEVNAVCLAVEKRCPDAGSVIELGGQDAKIIIFKEDPASGRKKKIPSMNDKCAGGTGAVLDKINAKLRIPPEELGCQRYDGITLHHVAGKCGVFAETDINSLQKRGVSNDELMASLFDAIVNQNLSVLTRGHTLRPQVLLLGGPNTYIRGMQEAWKAHIPVIWKERGFRLPEGVDPKDLVRVPEHAQYFAAIGAVEFGKEEPCELGAYAGWKGLECYVRDGRRREKKGSARGLCASAEELEAFKRAYVRKPFVPATFPPDEAVQAFIGLDGGSTSTKAVLLNRQKEVLAKAYRLSAGNPIDDVKAVIAALRGQVEIEERTLEILGVGTTGYAKDLLKDILKADVAIVETVAHTESALRFYRDVDVICDVGGQDIKIMILRNGKVEDFKINTQCSAGNGYFLQSTARDFGVAMEQYADVAFHAQAMPEFFYGCAVFMQSDIVDFQRQGWTPPEIMAGLAAVLPKNIWIYIVQIQNLASLGRNFVLQGGTQYNLAAVKAQVDFIRSRFRSQGQEPNIIVHDHCGETGAIGAALEAIRLWEDGRQTTFIGLDAVARMKYSVSSGENTRCHFCSNACLRTFIDVDAMTAEPSTRRLIVGNSCEKGTVEDAREMREIIKVLDATLRSTPNFAAISAREAFRSFSPGIVSSPVPACAFTSRGRRRAELSRGRGKLRIGIPRVMNIYSVAPLFTSYFESLGLSSDNIVFSDYTTEKLFTDGIKRGSIDPCFPSKLAIPHVHNLIYSKHAKRPLDIIFFPMVDDLTTELVNTQGTRACPTVTATPEALKAAFTKEGDVFKAVGITFMDTFVNIGIPKLFERQMYEQFKEVLGLSPKENAAAVAAGYAALRRFQSSLRQRAREVLDRLEAEHNIGIVLLGRPYQNDPGINHQILDAFQKLGYPILTQESLPLDTDILDRLFGDDVRAGYIAHPLDISDVWKNSYSENTSRKVWAAKFTARHPNLVALELSSFKCSHDAPIYNVIKEIIESSGKPYFGFKDLDENKPAGSIRIRVETIAYFLKRYREEMIKEIGQRKWVGEQCAAYEEQLRRAPVPDEHALPDHGKGMHAQEAERSPAPGWQRPRHVSLKRTDHA